MIGIIPFLLGFAPSLWVLLQGRGGAVSSIVLTRSHFLTAWKLLWLRTLPRLLTVHSERAPSWTGTFLLLVLCLAMIPAAFNLATCLRKRSDSLIWVPFLFLGLFGALYFPNHMAVAARGAPRYLIPFWSMLTALVFGLAPVHRDRWTGRLGLPLVSLWVAVQATLLVTVSLEKAAETRAHRADTREIVEAARATSTPYFYMLGAKVWGLRGQAYTFAARNDIRFVSLYDERYHPAAEAIEAEPHYGFAARTDMIDRIAAALAEMNVAYDSSEATGMSYIYNFRVHPRKERAISPTELTVTATGVVEGDPAAVLDNRRDTWIKGAPSRTSLLLDLGKIRPLAALRLFSPEPHQWGLPKAYLLERSIDGETFTAVRPPRRRIALSYTLGDRVYFKGYYGMQTIWLNGLSARYLRFTPTETQGNREFWSLYQLLVLEDHGETRVFSSDDAASSVAWLGERNIDFVITDRRVSALLPHADSDGRNVPDTFPCLNPRVEESLLDRRFQPRPGLALMVAEAVADHVRDVLTRYCGADVIADTTSVADQVILTLRAPAHPHTFLWNGYTVVYAEER